MDYIVDPEDAKYIGMLFLIIVANTLALGFMIGNLSGSRRVIKLLEKFGEEID